MQIQAQFGVSGVTSFMRKMSSSQSVFESPQGEKITQKHDELTGQNFYKNSETGKGVLSPNHKLAIMEHFGGNKQAAFEHMRKLEGSLLVIGDYRIIVSGSSNNELSIHNTRTGFHKSVTNIPDAKAFLRSLDGVSSERFSQDLLSELLANWSMNSDTAKVSESS